MLRQIFKSLIGGSSNGGRGAALKLRGTEYQSERIGGVSVLIPRNKTSVDIKAMVVQQKKDLDEIVKVARNLEPDFEKLKAEVKIVKKQVEDLDNSTGAKRR